ncbi:MAG: phage baseplate assembly protein V [Bryobacteraceae bacterium]
MRPAYLKVTFDGADIHDLSPGAILEEARIEYGINEHARCTLYYRQTPDQRFPIEDLLGKPLEVIAVDAGGAELKIFVGETVEVELDYDISGSWNLRVEGASLTLRMDLTPRHRSYEPAEFREHFIRAAGFSGLRVHFDATRPELGARGGLLQIGETDFEFVRRFADLAGCALRATARGFHILDRFMDTGCSVEWRSEGGLLDFRLVGRLAPREFRGWIYNRRESMSYIETRSVSPPQFGPAAGLISAAEEQSSERQWRGELVDPLLARNQRGLQAVLDLESQRAAQSRVYGRGISREASILAGNKLTINGPIDTAGEWGVLKVVHHWTSDGYWNEFIASPFERPLEWNRPVRRPWTGLLVARVTRLGEGGQAGRVQVQFPWAEGEPWFWVPFLSPNAGPNRGVYFSPEVGDEVLIGFEFGDTTRPVILGSAWNGVHPPPTAAVHGGEYANNDVKRIVTKSGNRLVMDDKEGKETIVLATPQHVRVSLFDEGSKLLLHCDGDIHIHAGGTIHMKCSQFLREIG